MPSLGAGPDPSPERASVDVGIINWNTPEAAVASAHGYLASIGVTVTVTVIDNASEPDARERLVTSMPAAAQLQLSEENLGFGVAANRVLAMGSSEFVCISNADVVPEPSALERMAAICNRPECGMVGPAFADRSVYHAELPSAPALAMRPLIGGFRHRAVASPGPGETIEVGQPAGACFLVRRAIWERVGGFDEDFFLWYEDVDLARRLHDAGLRNYISGDAVVHHEEGLATRTLPAARHQAARLKGLRLYLRKHHPLTARLATPVFAVATILRVRGA
jgi:GT2 family glycosyltransferase